MDKRSSVSKLPFMPPESLSHPILSIVLIAGTFTSEKRYGLKHNKIITHTSQNMLNLSPGKDSESLSPFLGDVLFLFLFF